LLDLLLEIGLRMVFGPVAHVKLSRPGGIHDDGRLATAPAPATSLGIKVRGAGRSQYRNRERGVRARRHAHGNTLLKETSWT
jgi:hypothetical protein